MIIRFPYSKLSVSWKWCQTDSIGNFWIRHISWSNKMFEKSPRSEWYCILRGRSFRGILIPCYRKHKAFSQNSNCCYTCRIFGNHKQGITLNFYF